MSAKLRVGVLTRSLELPAWQWAMMRSIVGSSYAEVVLVVILDAPDPQRAAQSGIRHQVRRLLQGAGEWLEAKAAIDADALVTRRGDDLLGAVPAIRLSKAAETPMSRVAGPESQIETYAVDVFLDLAGGHANRRVIATARYGVWSVQHGDERAAYGEPPGFWEVYFRVPVTASAVRQTTGEQEPGKVLCSTLSSTDHVSVRRNCNAVYWKCASMVPRKLQDLQCRGERALCAPAVADGSLSTPPGRRGGPTVRQLAWHVGSMVMRGLRNKIAARATIPQWILLFHFGERLSTQLRLFQEIVPSKDRFWADPHVIFRGGKYYVFFEEYLFAKERGHISVIALDRQGRHGTPSKVLDRGYHLSYPFVFEHEGELFMVPESAENRTVELYRCTDFPGKWAFVRNLLDNVYAVDATLVRHAGKWWLFANMIEHEGASPWDELFLFHSDGLEGKWTPHPMNPIVSDVRKARPAGPIFSEGGCLYRPAQDCSVRYGFGVRIHHIMKLSEEDYAEVEVESIEPTWDRKIIGTHTLSHAQGLTVGDALRPRRRFGSRA